MVLSKRIKQIIKKVTFFYAIIVSVQQVYQMINIPIADEGQNNNKSKQNIGKICKIETQSLFVNILKIV